MEVDGDVAVVPEDLAGGRDPADDAVEFATEAMGLIRPLAFILTAVSPTSSCADLVGHLVGLVPAHPAVHPDPVADVAARSWCTGC